MLWYHYVTIAIMRLGKAKTPQNNHRDILLKRYMNYYALVCLLFVCSGIEHRLEQVS